VAAFACSKINIVAVCHAFDGRRISLGNYRGYCGGRRKHPTQSGDITFASGNKWPLLSAHPAKFA
jgi:hypothetical protein